MPKGFVFGMVAARGKGRFGIKADCLRSLAQARFLVPRTALVSADAQEYYRRGDPGIIGQIRQEFEDWVEGGPTYTIRASPLEGYVDELAMDFPFTVRSGMRGPGAIASSIEKLYLEAARLGGAKGPARIGALVQEEVPPVMRGTSYSLNPLTGTQEVLVEVAREGGGEGGVFDRWTWRLGQALEAPTDRTGEEVVRRVVERTRRIEEVWGRPVALEWVQGKTRLYWLQARTVAEPAVNVYSSTFSRSFLPGPIKPLVWSVNSVLVNGSWARLFREIRGEGTVDARALARLFFFQSYFNVTALRQVWAGIGLPPDTLERMMGVGPPGHSSVFRPSSRLVASSPKLAAFAFGNAALSSRIEEHIALAREEYRSFQMEVVSSMAEEEILARVDQLFPVAGETSYYNILVPITTLMYERLLRGYLEGAGIDGRSFDLGKETEADGGPEACLAGLKAGYERLDPPVRASIRAGGWSALASMDQASELREEVRRCIDDFGYVSERVNDFSATPWRENPDAVIRRMIEYRPPADGGSDLKGFDELRIPAARRPLAMTLHARAKRYRALKGQVSALFTYGYGLFRPYFLELGARLVGANLIEDRNDVFFLDLDEVRQIVAGGCADNTCNNYRLRVALRKRDMEQAAGLVLPEVMYGETPPPLELLAPSSAAIQGAPGSRGYFKGAVRTVGGTSAGFGPDEGEVAVLAARAGSEGIGSAGAVIAAEGGLLSDAAIAARLRGIPAVLGVKDVGSLPSGVEVAVDGYSGRLVVAGRPPGERGRVSLRLRSQAQ